MKISILAKNQFRTRSLLITPEVVGRKHEFQYNDHLIIVSLPTLNMLTPLDELVKLEQYDDVLLFYDAYNEENGEKHPIFYYVGYVEVTTDNVKTISLPEEILNHAPNAYNFLSEESQNRLNKIATNQGEVAEGAFNFWLEMIRWKSNSPSIGRPEVRTFKSGWGTYLLDSVTQKKNLAWE